MLVGTSIQPHSRADDVSPVLEHKNMDGEIRTGIRPCGDRLPSRSARQCRKGIKRVFIAVLGVDGLAGAEFEHPACHPHLLSFVAGEMHFDAAAIGIVESMVAEICKIEIAIELAVDARE